MAAYLTPAFLDELRTDLDQRGQRGELTDRRRSLETVPGHGYEETRVTLHGNGAWTVRLDFHIEEHVRGMTVKQVDVTYPLRVIRYEVNPELNPWGLALDGYGAGGPRRLGPDTAEAAR